jgi:phosphatidylglycerophosphatase A
MPKFLVRFISTFFYLGRLPLIPGTWASLAALLIFFSIKANPSFGVLLFLVSLILGFAVSGTAEELSGRKDPSVIVIDEVCGMWLVLVLLPYEAKVAWWAFAIFRIFDILKPYPIRAIQNLKGSLGVMGDDILAALYTVIVLKVWLKLFVS